MDSWDGLLVGAAGLAAGLVNGVAGGGSLISFPALMAAGYSALTSNVTSTVGIWPGYLGGVAGFRAQLAGQGERLRRLAGTSVVGAAAGAALLLAAPRETFAAVAPYLILFACALFALQPLLSRRLQGDDGHQPARPALLHLATFAAAGYGAYFGAGLGVILLAVLGLALPDRLVRLNGLRSVLALLVNTVAVAVFVVVAPVAWEAAGLMAGTSLVGGWLGAHAAQRIPPALLRACVIGLGTIAAARLLMT